MPAKNIRSDSPLLHRQFQDLRGGPRVTSWGSVKPAGGRNSVSTDPGEITPFSFSDPRDL
jgi:hypothetical protein